MTKYNDLTYIKRFPNRRPNYAKRKQIPFKGTTVIEYLCYTFVALGFDLFIVYLLFFG